jgi:sugar phosphate isomerase/epimerase
MNMNRRNFVKTSALSLSGAALMPEETITDFLKKKRKLGVQLFTIPKMASTDLRGTLKLMSETGYKEVEFFGPYDFSAPETIENWKALAGRLGIERNSFYGHSIPEVVKMLKTYGLKSPSIHLDVVTMRKNMTQMLDAIAPLGVKYIALPSISDIAERTTLDDYKRRAEEFNHFGEQMSKYGASFVYHNHGYEHAEKDGQIPMHYLLKNTDPKFVKFEMDIFWLQAGGGNPIEFLKAYPNRYKLMHIKDASKPVRFSGDGGTPDQWIALFPLMSDPGDGVFELQKIVTQATASGVEHFFLERDLTPTPESTLKNSFKNLSKLK